MVSIKECLLQASRLSDVSDSARLDAELLLCRALGCTRTHLFSWPEEIVGDESYQHFQELLGERELGRPIAHLLGEREFWSLPLQVNQSTLIPRPDTEILVESVLALEISDRGQVLDLGTGTGAIAIALATENPEWRITAVDYSADAVALAKSNVLALGMSNVTVSQSNWFEGVASDKVFDVVVSNPPYIDAQDPHLQEGDVRFEPISALVSGDRGFSDLFLIAQQARKYLCAGGWLLLEHGYDQAQELRDKLAELGYQNVTTHSDYSGHDRVTVGRYV